MLSKRWTDLWRSVPTINLSMMDFEGVDGYVDVRWQKMKNFTTDLLMLHNSECLDGGRVPVIFLFS